MQSYKTKSTLTNVLVFICTFITSIGVVEVGNMLPDKYKYLASTIVAFAGFLLVQLTEDKRVGTAETIAVEDTLNAINSPNQEGLNAEYRKL